MSGQTGLGDLRHAQNVRHAAPPQAAPANTAEAADGRLLVGAGGPYRARRRDGERLDHLFEEWCDRLRAAGEQARTAVDTGEDVLTFDELDARANRLARHLLRLGVRPGERIALIFDRAVHSYVGMLAVLKVNAAYVPLDPGFPADRLAYIVRDAGVRTVLSLSHLHDRVGHLQAALVYLDEAEARVAAEDGRRLGRAERGGPADDLCYIVYTSGSTGRPKGVAVEHASICNFVRVASQVYGLGADDRVYQGMTIAFDFSVEEIWVPLLSGATLVPRPPGVTLLGRDLADFLRDRRITALCCVPTLLATLEEEDLPGLRFLLVSGEACPADLVRRWHRPGRRFLNVYGPTEATVTATWAVLDPGRPVTLGVPLPTYAVTILDPAGPRALPRGELGEIGIAGVGLARGYVGRDDLTARAFIPDFLGVPDNPSGRIYRTGDLGRINGDGEIEYHGRIDTQVQINGYRVELSEIESVLLRVPGIAQAVVDTHEPEPGVVELVAYYSARDDAPEVDPERVYRELRGRLPGYMIPAYLEPLPRIPMLLSNKADRKSLPPPSGPRCLSTTQSYAPPATPVEQGYAEVLAGVIGAGQVSVDGHFFEELGASSLLMARFCARVRERADLPPVSIKDVYLHPTVRDLARAADVPAAPATPAPPVIEPERASTAAYVLCGAAQALLALGYAVLGALLLAGGYTWVFDAEDTAEIYGRSLACAVVIFTTLCAVPIAAKWALVGRWKPGRFRVWSPAYLRFWTVRTLLRICPLALFAGSPLYVLYLRALGAKIGPDVLILSRNVPVCTDLLTVGGGTVIRKDSFLSCYRARAGMIEIGPVTIGAEAFVGERTVVDIGTAVGDRAQLGHSSSLQEGQSVPDGEVWHGSPAQPAPAGTRYAPPAPVRCGAWRRARFATVQLVTTLAVYLPLTIGGLHWLSTRVPALDDLADAARQQNLGTWPAWADALAISLAVYLGGLAAGLALVVSVPRLLARTLRPDRDYPLYGFHYWAHRVIARITGTQVFTHLFGDSSWIVGYQRAIGYDLSKVEQTGSNFGLQHKHESPFLTSIGSGTMISDGLSIVNADFSAHSFRLSRATIGAHSFLGNDIAYPAKARTGENCLLATKVMVPVDGPVLRDVGLLGSPCFEIPRSVQRDGRFDHLKTGDELHRRLAAKTRHNTVTIALYLVSRWLHLFGLVLLGAAAAALREPAGAAAALALALVSGVVFTTLYFALVERLATGFRALTPRFCSIYQPYYWWHERVWKLTNPTYLELLNGTPFKSLLWRLVGVRIGRRVFDDGCGITERTLVTIGDDCTLGQKCDLQAHSLEDGTFKSDHILIGAGCTVGTGALVHYGVRMGDGAVLAADAFLMKGEEVAPGAHWCGNPAVRVG
ncbi:peptide synthetase [Sphaerisporangium melleum]|uniref:Peptide synthetase n=1 Tax=Sphaerisporangium melleum TaxID=321316 RepID=A0A917VH11_9ACTN|nr:Pls/PosA family non-ribosomal peptide synthetase [Sphaerisporangium melleum]GGK79720.1 peptide synthetase [Sphaerisporangium melleum]GII69667.1 peptide synthetase [Sphaerisporangium melleum]